MFTSTRLLAGVCACVFSSALLAVDKPNALRKTSFSPPASAGLAGESSAKLPGLGSTEPLVFSAPPRESADEANRLYQPVADYLSRTLGRRVNYVYPRNWLSYQKEMTKGNYDIVFDGSHFNSWRIQHLQHNTVAKVPEQQMFAVITRKDNTQITSLKQLAGKKVCGMGASNLGVLAMQAEFDAARQPLLMEQISWGRVYESVMENRCIAGIVSIAVLRKLDSAGNFTRVIHQSRQLPNQAFSAGPRVTAEEQGKLAKALTATESRTILEPVLSANGVADKGLVIASKEDFAGMDTYLKDVWGYTR
ncbi:MAG TPA: PhnD/SsuA/transferrin family substrate-binding protein [Burkholderiales bacterium]|nr:PhnD/SsuA/transferrin family substrate-binding protein [Burkholderiales bacterium]